LLFVVNTKQAEVYLLTKIINFQAERELKVAQAEFDRQAEITRLLLEGISSSHASHLRCLHEMVQAQANFHAQANTIMQSLATEIAK
jgi:hypothetical protein